MTTNIFRMIFLALLLSSKGFSQQSTIYSEEIEIKNGKFALSGILSYEPKKEKIPLVIYVHGSGNIDRNGNQKGMVSASYIQQLADSLCFYDMAVFRYDKRTANPENLALKEMQNVRFEDFADDVIKIVNHFKDDKRFSEIILIGHSQGSLTAMLACQKVKIDKFISIAGASERLKETLISQLAQQAQPLADKAKEHFLELQKTDTIQNVHPFLISIFAPQNQKFIKSWNAYNPSEEITKLKIPVLIINGTLDKQVSVSDAEKLHKAYPNSQLKIIPNMTHTLKIIENPADNMLTYTQPNFLLSSELVKTIVEFINP